MTFSSDVVSTLLDNFADQAALVDHQGTIMVTNRAWKGVNSPLGQHHSRPESPQYYLPDSLAELLNGFDRSLSESMYKGIESVLRGDSEEFVYNYESASTGERFRLRAASFRASQDQRWAVLLHTNVTNGLSGPAALEPLVTVCGWCRRISDGPHWKRFEEYFKDGVRFTHGICPHCRTDILAGGSAVAF